MKIANLVLAIMFIHTAIFGQWRLQNPEFNSSILYDIKFPDSLFGYVSGANGAILKTTDGGVKWRKAASPDDDLITDISFINRDTGWIRTYSGKKLYKTTDGGKSWELKTEFGPGLTNNICFVNDSVGFVSGEFLNFAKTTNGGETWDSTQLGRRYDESKYIAFASDSLGFVVVGDTLFITNNQGGDWEKIFTIPPQSFVNDMKFEIKRLNLTDSYKGFVSGGFYDLWGNLYGYVIYTNSGSANFRTITVSGQSINSAYFTADNRGWISSGGLQYTTDSGENWETVAPSMWKFTKTGEGTFAGINNTQIYKTADFWNSCESENESVFNSFIWCVSAPDSNRCAAAGRNRTVLSSSDGGENWKIIYSGDDSKDFLSILYKNKNEIFVCGEGGKLLRTTNGGTDWVESNLSGVYLNSIDFADDETGYVTGFLNGENYIFKTTDGGETWKLFPNDMELDWINKIKFRDRRTGWVLGFQKCYETRDGGKTFTEIPIPGGWDIETIDNYVWITKSNYIYISTDFGATWISEKMFDYGNILFSDNNISFADTLNGFASLYDARILRTSDGGFTWNKMHLNDKSSFFDISFADANNGWAVGDNGVILNYNNSTVSVPVLTKLPEKIELYQNFPNPVSKRFGGNPSTTISFFMQEKSFITLTLFNSIGQEVRTLISEEVNIGTHEIPVDMEGLSSGVYFYELRSGNERRRTKKMLYLK